MNDKQAGHRERLKERFQHQRLNGFHNYEILELLLFYCIPRKDTKPIAKQLIQTFGSLPQILDASADELSKIKGLGNSSILFIQLVREVINAYFSCQILEREQLRTLSELHQFLRARIGHESNEVLFAVFLNASNQILGFDQMSEGTVSEAAAYPRKVIEYALKYKATTVILAHNHPGGIAEPSDADIQMTSHMKSALDLVGVCLQEHLIIAGEKYYSFRRDGDL